jgi:hypothetical protein
MKSLFLAVVLMVVSATSNSQRMFDGFIDGVGIGNIDESVAFLKEKGYELVDPEKYETAPLIFLTGKIDDAEVVICIVPSEEDSTVSKKITIYFPSSENYNKIYKSHKKQFMKNFGKPDVVRKNRCYWKTLGTDDYSNLKYAIGVEDNRVYHSLENIDY